jgi:hypothetical protein
MRKLEPPESDQPSVIEAIRRGWDWVVFSVKILGRIGGLTAWIFTLHRAMSILWSRLSSQQQHLYKEG